MTNADSHLYVLIFGALWAVEAGNVKAILFMLHIPEPHALALAVFRRLSRRRNLVILHLTDKTVAQHLVYAYSCRIGKLGAKLRGFGILLVFVAEGGLSLFLRGALCK